MMSKTLNIQTLSLNCNVQRSLAIVELINNVVVPYTTKSMCMHILTTPRLSIFVVSQ